MKSTYWNSVKERFLSLAKTALKTAVPFTVDTAIVLSVNKACSIIESKLALIYKKSVINSSITLTINILGILILFFNPFSKSINFLISGLFFLSSFVFWFIRTFVFIKNYGDTSLHIIKNIYKERSICFGLETYIYNSFPQIALMCSGISIGEKYIPSLKKIPRISDFIQYFVNYFRKQIILYITITCFYTILVFWIIKPILIRNLI